MCNWQNSYISRKEFLVTDKSCAIIYNIRMTGISINKQDSKAAQAAIKILFEVLPKSARGIHNIAYTFGLISREAGIPSDQATDLIMAWSERLRALPNFKELYPIYKKLSLYRYQVRYAVQSAYKRTNDMPSSARFKTLTGKKAPAASFWDKSDDLDKSAPSGKTGSKMEAASADAEKEKLSAERGLPSGAIVAADGSSYFGPITVLLEKMEKYIGSGPGEAGGDNIVNGFASSICLLAVTCLEAYIMKIRSEDKSADDQIKRAPLPDYVGKLYPDFPLVKELVEIYMLRNMIAHNPVRVGASDATKVLHTVWNTLIFLEKKNSVLCQVSNLSVRYKSKMVKFGKVIGLPETCR